MLYEFLAKCNQVTRFCVLFIGENFGNQSRRGTFRNSLGTFCLTINHDSWIFPLRNATNHLLKAFLDLEKSRFKVDSNFSIFQVFLNRDFKLGTLVQGRPDYYGYGHAYMSYGSRAFTGYQPQFCLRTRRNSGFVS